jgi:hypothetical protein
MSAVRDVIDVAADLAVLTGKRDLMSANDQTTANAMGSAEPLVSRTPLAASLAGAGTTAVNAAIETASNTANDVSRGREMRLRVEDRVAEDPQTTTIWTPHLGATTKVEVAVTAGCHHQTRATEMVMVGAAAEVADHDAMIESAAMAENGAIGTDAKEVDRAKKAKVVDIRDSVEGTKCPLQAGGMTEPHSQPDEQENKNFATITWGPDSTMASQAIFSFVYFPSAERDRDCSHTTMASILMARRCLGRGP